jgi:hypothetical protein
VPARGWVQPPAARAWPNRPSKRRIKSLLDASGLSARLDLRSAAPGHARSRCAGSTDSYLQAFQALSEAEGGALGEWRLSGQQL